MIIELYKILSNKLRGDKSKLTLFTVVMLVISDLPIYFFYIT